MNRYLFKQLNDCLVATGCFCQPQTQFVVRSLVLIVATVGAIGFGRAADELPGQDQALARALENHPDIVAAKAKVALAEAELYGKRMEISRQILGLYCSLKTLDSQFDAARETAAQEKAEYERTNTTNRDGSPDQAVKDKFATLRAAEGKLVQITGQREQVETELRLLIGATPQTKEAKAPNAAAVLARQAPQGPIIGTWNAAAQGQIQISLTEAPLIDVMSFLSDKTGIQFSVQRQALEDAGLAVDMPISLSTYDVPLSAALQGFEDSYPELQFILRDYGILLTTKDYAHGHGYMPALAIGKEGSSVKSR